MYFSEQLLSWRLTTITQSLALSQKIAEILIKLVLNINQSTIERKYFFNPIHHVLLNLWQSIHPFTIVY